MERTNLLLAAGHSRDKKLYTPERGAAWNGRLITIDINPDCGADVIFDLGELSYPDTPGLQSRAIKLPFADASVDEIHAYDCLEHWGRQGDWRGWFDEMAEYHRVLKPGGEFAAVVPVGLDHFADPGHTRFFSLNYFLFLSKKWCAEQRRLGTSAADYGWYWKLDFDVVESAHSGNPAHHLGVILRKPQ